ncbi:hypothetical protein PHPALM_31849 [Phytophthora palmivora]|uniref:CS domain-containing protein n=1 Tax=Phytophthora palmivora TaxID=4796 RepID=A0A2P4X1L4_9STRA|nr:hypothetical protein PHPALM_31849 [Phytophthora palmivora]
MFQDIAPTRTSVIAIRSKRNKRKLNAQAAAAAAAASGVYGMRASPRSVAGTPRTPYMGMGGAQNSPPSVGPNGVMIEPHPQRARKYMATSSGMNYNGMMQQQQQQPMSSMSWSSHLMQPNASAASPMQQQTPQNQQAPVQTPGSGAGNSPGAVEWALGGFEIHPDGSMNTARPIYRCPQCRRLNDVDMLAAGPAVSHSPQCVFAPNNGNMMYRSQMEGTPMNQQQQMQQQRGYAAYQQLAQQSMGMSTPQTSTTNSYGSSAMVDSSSLNVQQNTVNITSKPEDVSPKTLATFTTSSTQRPSMTISPYMNKVTTEGNMSGNSGQEQGSTSGSGNLFESNAFHNQMEMMSNGTEKLFMNKNTTVEDDPALDPQQQQPQNYQQDTGSSFNGVIGTSLFNEMTSMGINLDQYDKGDSQLLGELNGLGGAPNAPNDEDQVFYILARMYTDAQERKLGLPAFDQFQRMLGFYSEAQDDVQTQVVFHPLRDVCLSNEEREKITSQFVDELGRDSQAVHSLPKYQHNLIMLREDALMFYWSQSLFSQIMSETKALWAPVKWAQRKEALYVTVDLPDVKDEKVTLNSKNLTFQGTSNGQLYEVKLDFFKEVDVESKDSIWAKTDRNLHFHIVKKNQDEEFWPRLLADKHLEKTNVKVDWSKFVDEDDEDEEQGGFDMSALNGGGGFDINQMMAAQNAAGMMDDDSDSDDEDMPDLDPNNQ